MRFSQQTLIQTTAEKARQVSSQQLARLGQFSFINCLPVLYPFTSGAIQTGAEMVLDSPSGLNQRFAQSELDVSAMSSFFYLQHKPKLMTGLSISCRGPVGSVLFFSKLAPEQLGNAKIAVSPLSATSVNLLRIFLKQSLGIDPEMVPLLNPDLESEDISAALLIGDQAMLVDEEWSKKYWRLDLGKWWCGTYRVPMVFGLWAARPDWAETHPMEMTQLRENLMRARTLGLTTLLKQVIEQAHQQTGLSKDRLERYYKEELDFQLTDKHFAGLRLYEKLAKQHGLLV